MKQITLGVEIRTDHEATDYLDLSARITETPPDKIHGWGQCL